MLIFGHRGMPSSKIQENTLPSFIQALQAGADGIEFDIHLSKDDQIIIGHDKGLSRIAGTAQKIQNLTAKELQQIPLRGQGTILTLDQLITQIPDYYLLDIEIKDKKATQPLIKKLQHSTQLRKRSIISSFDIKILQNIKNELPQTQIILLFRAWPWYFLKKKLWQQIFSLQPWALATRVNFLTQRRIGWLHQHNILIGAYDDISRRRSTRKIIYKDLDLAITFRPDLARLYIKQ